jgi:Domain of unknown function (DUF222)
MPTSAVGYRHPAVEAVAAIDDGLTALASASLWSLSAAELAQLVVTVERIARRVAAAQLPLLAQADSSQVAALTGASSTAAWLRDVADVPIAVSRGRLALRQSLLSRPTTAGAFNAGEISFDSANAVCAAVEALPPAVPAMLYDEIEQLLVETARDEGTRAVVHRAADITHRFAPQVLEADEQAAREARWLSLTQRHDGTVAVRGLLDKEAGALAIAVLSPLATPTPATADGIPDLRTVGQRHADALTRICQQATTTNPHVRGEPAHVSVGVGLAALQGVPGSPPATLGNGTPLSIEATRRLACDAKLIPIVLGAASEPLDIGRITRLIPTAIRRALNVRDGGCAFPGCDRPPHMCDAHHIVFWADGGPTAICNLCLLCGHHHDTIHHHGWTITMRDGRPWFIPHPGSTPPKHHA